MRTHCEANLYNTPTHNQKQNYTLHTESKAKLYTLTHTQTHTKAGKINAASKAKLNWRIPFVGVKVSHANLPTHLSSFPTSPCFHNQTTLHSHTQNIIIRPLRILQFNTILQNYYPQKKHYTSKFLFFGADQSNSSFLSFPGITFTI